MGNCLALAIAFAGAGCPVVPPGVSAQVQATELRGRMKAAAAEYERALRRSAPVAFSTIGGNCDEYVGRFCLVYDGGPTVRLPAEPPAIERAREKAIETFTRGAAHWPEDSLVAAPLVRFLIEAGRAAHGRAVAERLTGFWRHALLGLAYHHEGAAHEAGAAFELMLATMDSATARKALTPRVLLARPERGRYDRLVPGARALYEERLWRLAEPLLLTSGNEARNEHLARYVWTRILPQAPVVTGSVSWGWDVDELTRRFGVPVRRTRDLGTGITLESTIEEHFDPEQITYVPPEPTRLTLTISLPGAAWPYDTIRSSSGFAPHNIRGMRPLEHQLSRFNRGEQTRLRADAVLPLDTLVRLPADVEFGLFALDSSFRPIASVVDTVRVTTASAVGQLTLTYPPNAFAYSVEARDLGSGLSGRARHVLRDSLEMPSAGRLGLSDLIVLPEQMAPGGLDLDADNFEPLPSLVIPSSPLALYFEVYGLTPNDDDRVRYRVDLEVGPLKSPGALTRAIRAAGRSLGLGNAGRPRVTWNAEAPARAALPVGFNAGDLDLNTGLNVLRITVTDLLTSAQSRATRVVRVMR